MARCAAPAVCWQLPGRHGAAAKQCAAAGAAQVRASAVGAHHIPVQWGEGEGWRGAKRPAVATLVHHHSTRTAVCLLARTSCRDAATPRCAKRAALLSNVAAGCPAGGGGRASTVAAPTPSVLKPSSRAASSCLSSTTQVTSRLRVACSPQHHMAASAVQGK